MSSLASWNFNYGYHNMPEPPVDPPESDFDKYEYQWEWWLNDNYDKETNTICGVDADNNEELEDKLWDRFMDEVVNNWYDGP